MSEEWPIEDQFGKSELDELIASAEGGDPLSQDLLGARLAIGNGVEPDVNGSIYWFSEAIKKGYVPAKWNAGSMFVDGEEGLERNLELGIRLIREAAEAFHNSACLFLAAAYGSGNYGLPRDSDQANEWREKAWNMESAKEFDVPLDISSEYGLNVHPPSVELANKD